jgi:hypothetical protein
MTGAGTVRHLGGRNGCRIDAHRTSNTFFLLKIEKNPGFDAELKLAFREYGLEEAQINSPAVHPSYAAYALATFTSSLNRSGYLESDVLEISSELSLKPLDRSCISSWYFSNKISD